MRYYGAILPNTKIFGGVKRFLELGNEFVRLGIGFVIFTPEGSPPEWFAYHGRVRSFDAIGLYQFDALFITESQYIPLLLSSNSKRKIFYYVTARLVLRRPIREKLIIFVNSTTTYINAKRYYRINPTKAFGGINLEMFTPKLMNPVHQSTDPVVIMAYGRLTRRKKGTSIIVKACEELYKKGYNIKLLLFDSPIDENSRQQIRNFDCELPYEFVVNHPVGKNKELFHRADIFVTAERGGGWSNTAAEAAACGIPVIATKNGTQDFVIHNETGIVVRRFIWSIKRAIARLYDNPELRQRYSIAARKKIEEFSWKDLALKIDRYCCDETTT